MQKLKVGDTVQVMAGAERTSQARRGKVLVIDREARRACVEGLRLVKKHLKKGRDKNNPEGGRIEKAGSIALASLAVICPKCDKPTRVGIRLGSDKNVRICKKCDASID